ncbi:MAG TPA: peptidoglycan-associated lipoprotein Pal [Steroidobacteraceae bacterium]|jgi:peptidoglycan-associated lipoprotein
MKKMLTIALLLVGTVMLAGCPKKHTVKETPNAGTQVQGNEASTNGNEGASTNGNELGNDNASRGINTESGPFSRKIIYFDFDKSEIKPEFADIVSAAAKTLVNNPSVKLRLEGSTDERGTREYNIGLGERRAQAVRRALMLQGVAESQLSTVSYGSERPAAEGDDESAWSKNRRVELAYTQ